MLYRSGWAQPGPMLRHSRQKGSSETQARLDALGAANSVLVVTFANERLEHYKDSYMAALEAGYVRIRPVLMTAMAMIIGMVPMALGLGDGGEQNAPLGRAVIGGLIFATAATLFFVPTVFILVRKRRRVQTDEPSPELAAGSETGVNE